jgi:hypothetical protein
MDRITRRDLLGGVATIGAITVSGCAGQPDDVFGDDPDETGEENSSTDTDEGTPGPGGTDAGTTASGDGPTDGVPERVADAPGIEDASIETLQADCGSLDDNGITVEGDGSTVVVEAVLPAPNPCHRAVLDSVTVDDATLALAVDIADTTEDDEGCIMCRGVISYRAEVELANPPVESVTVDHATGGRHTGTPGPGTPGDPTPTTPGTPSLPTPVTDASIETVDSGCRTDDERPTAVEFSDEVITITGTLMMGNPCHEAVLESVTVDDERLSVAVDAQSTLDDDAACVDCLGAIDYETRIELADQSGITMVVVDHPPDDRTTVTR